MGFLRREEQALFEQPMSVSGVGPKLAQKILSSGTVENIVQRIQGGDIDMLTSIGGVGKKTAQKIILDLKECWWRLGKRRE
jgi:Holliday junction DNA helicase RuvA